MDTSTIEALLHQALRGQDAVTAALQQALHWLTETGNVPPARVRFDAPVGTAEERASATLWPGGWFDATGYAKRYKVGTRPWAVHTGCDLNCNTPTYNTDAHAPVYAAADGRVVTAGVYPVWGKIVVIEHTLEDGTQLWTRYAHLEKMYSEVGTRVERGTLIGAVGNAEGTQAWHLHYDIARIDLGANAKPTDWPGDDEPRVRRDYVDPLELTQARHG